MSINPDAPKLKSYYLDPTTLIPNSPYPLLHYRQILATPIDPAAVHTRLANNSWNTQWIYRYGADQAAHYHSATHETMVVLSGHATIRFGIADAEHNNLNRGIELSAAAGDVFIIPAGVAHKTFNTAPEASFKVLTPGDGHGIPADSAKDVLRDMKPDGFTMLGAYPSGSTSWDFCEGGNDIDSRGVWAVQVPKCDPMFGDAGIGLQQEWDSSWCMT